MNSLLKLICSSMIFLSSFIPVTPFLPVEAAHTHMTTTSEETTETIDEIDEDNTTIEIEETQKAIEIFQPKEHSPILSPLAGATENPISTTRAWSFLTKMGSNVETDYAKLPPESELFSPRLSENSEIIQNGKVLEPTLSRIFPEKNVNVLDIDLSSNKQVIRVTNIGVVGGVTLDALLEPSLIVLPSNSSVPPVVELTMDKTNLFNFYFKGPMFTQYLVKFTYVRTGTTQPFRTTFKIELPSLNSQKTVKLEKDYLPTYFTPKNSKVKYDIIYNNVLVALKTDNPQVTPTDTVTLLYKNKATHSLGVTLTETVNKPQAIETTPVRTTLPSPIVIGTKKGPSEEKEPLTKTVRVIQEIPEEPKGLELTNYDLKVPLGKHLVPIDLGAIKITGKNGAIAPPLLQPSIENKNDEQILHFKASPAYLADNSDGQNSLYGNTLIYDIPVQFDYQSDYLSIEDKEKKLISLPFDAELLTDEEYGTKKSNEAGIVEFTNQGKTQIDFVDQNGAHLLSKTTYNRIHDYITSEYDDKQGGYQKIKVVGEESGPQTREPRNITYHYEDNRYRLAYKMENLTNPNADTVEANDEVRFTFDICNNEPDASSIFYPQESNYANLDMSILYDTKNLTEPQEFTLLTSASSVPTISYSEENKKILIKGPLNASWKEPMTFSFKTKIKPDVIEGQKVSLSASSSATFTEGMPPSKLLASNLNTLIQTPQLEVRSVPSVIDFGKVPIGGKEKIHGIQTMDAPFVIQDHRRIGSRWAVYAQLSRELISVQKQATLKDALYFKEKEKLVPLKMNETQLVHIEKNDTKEAVTISADWISKNEGLILNTSTESAYSDHYETTIEWLISDTPDLY